MKKAIKVVVQEITQELVLEMEGRPSIGRSAPAGIIDHLLQQLTNEVTRQLTEANAEKDLPDENIQAKLQKVERKLEKRGLIAEDDDNDKDEDEVTGAGSNFPNLKYAKPKYKNIESILKYAENDGDKGGVRLVIMNFND